MPLSASPAWDAWSELSARLPSDLDLDALGRSHGAIQRVRGDGINDGTTLFRVSLARGPGGKSLPETALWARQNGVAEIGGQALNERLHGSLAFLSAILHRLLAGRQAGKQAAKTSIWAGRCLRIADGSSISQRASKGTDWRVHGVYDLGLGGFSHLEITDVHGAESLLHCAPVGKEVLIGDRGYAKVKALQACLDRSGPQARDFSVRTGWRALVLRDRDGAPFDLIAHLAEVPAGDTPREWTVRPVLDGRKQPILPMIRLIAQPLPPDKVEAMRARLRQAASRKQQKLDPRTLLAAGFMVLATALPEDIPADEICAVYRLRWQIELAFKRLKSLLHIDRIPTRTTAGGLSWLYPHLILTLLTEDICQDFLAFSPEDLITDARCSQWRVTKVAIDAVVCGLAGLSIGAFLAADQNAHHLLADTKRTRKRQRF